MPTPNKVCKDLATRVCAYMNRQAGTFVVNGQDCVLASINNAKDFIQRAIDFELAKVGVTILNVGLQTGGSWAYPNAVLFSDGTTLVDLKKCLRGYLPFIDGSGQCPIDIISKQEWASRRKRLSLEFTTLHLNEAKALLSATGFAIVMDGFNFFVDPQSPQIWSNQTSINVYFDGIQWIQDFDYTTSHWLLNYGFDVLLYRSIVELNFFLKEDERMEVTKAVWESAWNNLVQWNQTVVANTTDVSLD